MTWLQVVGGSLSKAEHSKALGAKLRDNTLLSRPHGWIFYTILQCWHQMLASGSWTAASRRRWTSVTACVCVWFGVLELFSCNVNLFIWIKIHLYCPLLVSFCPPVSVAVQNFGVLIDQDVTRARSRQTRGIVGWGWMVTRGRTVEGWMVNSGSLLCRCEQNGLCLKPVDCG